MSIKSYIALTIVSMLFFCSNILFGYDVLSSRSWAQDDNHNNLMGGITFEGGEGQSIDMAVIIKGAKDIVFGTAAQYYYLEMKYGIQNVKWKLDSQSLIHKRGKHFDLLKIRLADGSQKEIYFDITEFFGKM